MECLDRIKMVVKWLIGSGVADTQEGVGLLLGYTNKSSFSQLLNGKKPLPANFIDKISDLNRKVNKVWIESGKGSMLISDSEVNLSPPESPREIPQTQLDILVQAIDRLSESEKNNSENVKELIAQGRQQTDNITRLIDLLCQNGVNVEPQIDEEKGGLERFGNSGKDSATDADRADVV